MDEQEQMLEQPAIQQALQHKWKVIGGVTVVVCLVLVVLSLFVFRPKNNVQSNQSSFVTRVSIPITSQPKSSPNPTLEQSLPSQTNPTRSTVKQYKDAMFSMEYPASWSVAHSESYGSEVITFGQDTSTHSSYPQIIISTLDKTHANYSLLDGAAIHLDDGFQESTYVIDGITATKLTGAFPPERVLKEYPNEPLMWETDLYLTKGNIEYVIRYTYPRDAQNDANAEEISNVLSTIKLY